MPMQSIGYGVSARVASYRFDRKLLVSRWATSFELHQGFVLTNC
jgi:hypothetical protein